MAKSDTVGNGKERKTNAILAIIIVLIIVFTFAGLVEFSVTEYYGADSDTGIITDKPTGSVTDKPSDNDDTGNITDKLTDKLYANCVI